MTRLANTGPAVRKHTDSFHADGPHEKTANKSVAGGYPSLDDSGKVPTVQLGGSGADATKFLRGDRVWTAAAGGAPTGAEYVVVTLDPTLSAERRLQVTAPLTLTDGGADGDIILGGLDTHEAAADPHAVYQKESEKGAASGYAPLDAGGLLLDSDIPAAIARDSELHAQSHDVPSHTGAPGGELGGTWTVPTVDAVHAGSAHHLALHTLTSHTTKPHATLTGLTAGDDHTQYQKETDFTEGSVLFRGASVIAENNAYLLWDDTNKRLGIAKGAAGVPQYRLDVGDLSYFAVHGLFAHIIQHNSAAAEFWSIAPRNGGNLDIALTTTDPRPTGSTVPTSGNAISIKTNKDVQFLAKVGVGVAVPAASALLELQSTVGAMLLTRLTTVQRDALTPIDGMLLYESTAAQMQGRIAGAWVDLGGAGGGGGVPAEDVWMVDGVMGV